MARPCEVRDPCRQGAARPSRQPEFPAAAVRNEPYEPFGRAGKNIHGGDIPRPEPEVLVFPPAGLYVVAHLADVPGRRSSGSGSGDNPLPG